MSKKIISLILAFALVPSSFQSVFATSLQPDLVMETTEKDNEKVNSIEINEETVTSTESNITEDGKEIISSEDNTNENKEEVIKPEVNIDEDKKEEILSENDKNEDNETKDNTNDKKEEVVTDSNKNQDDKSNIIDNKEPKVVENIAVPMAMNLDDTYKIYKTDANEGGHRVILSDNPQDDEIVYCFNKERKEAPLYRERAIDYKKINEEDIQNDSEILNKDKLKWAKNLLYVGYPNDPYNLVDKYNISPSMARQWTQLALWEILRNGDRTQDKMDKIDPNRKTTYYNEIITLALYEKLDDENITFSERVKFNYDKDAKNWKSNTIKATGNQMKTFKFLDLPEYVQIMDKETNQEIPKDQEVQVGKEVYFVLNKEIKGIVSFLQEIFEISDFKFKIEYESAKKEFNYYKLIEQKDKYLPKYQDFVSIKFEKSKRISDMGISLYSDEFYVGEDDDKLVNDIETKAPENSEIKVAKNEKPSTTTEATTQVVNEPTTETTTQTIVEIHTGTQTSTTHNSKVLDKSQYLVEGISEYIGDNNHITKNTIDSQKLEENNKETTSKKDDNNINTTNIDKDIDKNEIETNKTILETKSSREERKKSTRDKVPSTSDKTPYSVLILGAILFISTFIISRKNRLKCER